jgi:hypothetical protein
MTWLYRTVKNNPAVKKVGKKVKLTYNKGVISSQMKIFYAVVLSLGTLFYMPTVSSALSDISIMEADISVTTNPENPEPYQDVTIVLTSYSTDLSKAKINWYAGSTLLLSGYGKTSYSFKASGPNTSTVFTVDVSPSDGSSKVTKRIVINPSEIEILWESVDGYTPPFYRGKSFPSSGGVIRAVAFPNTNKIRQGKGAMSYTWKYGDNTVLFASGYNKDSYIFTNSELNINESISVTASSVDGQYSAIKSIVIPVLSPKIIFYKKSPSEGILYSSALGSETFMAEEEMTVVAEPYFFSLNNSDNLSYNWKINGKSIETPSRKTELTVHPSSRGGYATLGLVIENLDTFFQKVSGNLKINL